MRKTKIKETTKIYDKDGKLKEKIVREELIEDDETTISTISSTTYPKLGEPAYPWTYEPYCSTTACVNGSTTERSDINGSASAPTKAVAHA